MYGNFAAQAGVVSNVNFTSPNIITPTLTWDFSGVLVLDFNPPGILNINDRPRINVWRDVDGTPDFNFIQYISGGKNILSPAPTGNIFELWGDRRTGTYKFPSISIANRSSLFSFKQKIKGDNFDSSFGGSVATNNDGTVLIMGGYLDDDSGISAGAALIYTGSTQSGWGLKQKITGDSAGDQFGISVAVNSDGTVLIMGGYLDDDRGINAGAALIYTGSAQSEWVLKQKITGDSVDDQFGISVAVNSDGTVLMMGGYLDDDSGINAGAALIYTGSAQSGWGLKQKITGDSAGDRFGKSVATNNDGTVLIMGGQLDNDGGTEAGAALIYTGSAQSGWRLKQKITGDSAGDRFGSSVATNNDGTVLIMGGQLDNDGGTEAGAALIYTGSAQSGWGLKQKITGDSAGDLFGYSVATNNDGTVLMMGAHADDTNGFAAGAALIYTGSAQSGWGLKQKITGHGAGDLFGYSVATNNDGTVLMMGGLFANAAFIYTIPKFEITAGIDLFTFPYVEPISISPPLNQWTVTGSNIDELQYQYKFKVGETNPQFNIVLDYKSSCKPVNIPSCDPISQVLVYAGTNAIGCPIFLCKSRDSITSSSEMGSLYNPMSTWSDGFGRAEFGIWNIQTGSGSFRNIQFLSTTFPATRTSVGNNAFFFVGNSGSNPTGHRIDLNLINPMLSGSSLSLDVNYGWNGGSREIIFRGNNNNFAQYRFSHNNNDELRYFRSGVSNGSPPIINTLITGNVFLKAFNYELVHLGTGVEINVRSLPITNPNQKIYTDIATGNINLNTFISGISFLVSNLPNISAVDYFNYGIFFNNITYKNLPPPPSELFVKDVGTTNATVYWNDTFSATGYRLDLATDINFNNYVPGYFNKSITGTSQIITPLSKDTKYFARACSVNTYGTGNFSPILNFQTFDNILELSNVLYDAPACSKVTILDYTNNSNITQQIYINGSVDDELLINGNIYESGKYSFPWFVEPFPVGLCGYFPPINGAHSIAPFTYILLPTQRLLLENLSYQGNLGYNFNIKIIGSI